MNKGFSKARCVKIRKELETVKSLGAQMDTALKSASGTRDFSICRELRKQIDAILRTDRTEMGKMFQMSDLGKGNMERVFRTMIDLLSISDVEKAKLMAAFGSYDDAAATARELDPEVKLPSRKLLMSRFCGMGPEMMERIARVMDKPRLVIVPKKSFEELVEAIDAHPHHWCQMRVSVEGGILSAKPASVSAAIVDVTQYPNVLPTQDQLSQAKSEQVESARRYLEAIGMTAATGSQYLVAAQRGLRIYEATDKRLNSTKNNILDLLEGGNTTFTYVENDLGRRMFAFFTLNSGGLQIVGDSGRVSAFSVRVRAAVPIY